MSFHRSHPRQRRTCEEYKAELEEENYHLHSELQIEVDTNRQNERRINQLEQDYTRCEQEIQDLNKEIERLENASKEEIVELKSEISTLKSQLYQARNDVRDKGKYISSLEEQLVESEEQVKKLRCRIRSISSRKNSPEQGNSPDLYNSDDNMATITELANAIDGYVDNRATTRDILIDQIKRATRQIRRKENNLHQDLVREQRRRYDAEAERDNEIIRRQLAEGRITNVIGDLHQYQTNTQNQVNRMIGNMARKQARIGVLVQEKFALQLLYQRNAHHLQRSRGDIGLLEFNRDRLYERYEKWKNKTQAERQNNLNLQGQILALQNNPPNQVNMAGIPHPYFDWDDSIPDFLAQLRLDLQNRGIDPNDNAAGPPTGRDNALGHLRACMRGRTLEWFDDEITTKQNWELTNLLDNTGQANLVAVNGRTAVQIGANALNEAVGQPGNAIVKLRAVEDAWNEDWRIAGGRPTNDPVNAPNANAGNTVVVAGIRFGQAVWWLKTHFPTVEEELRDLMYGTIRKGDMTIDELYRKILRIGRRANYRPEELRRKFLDALPLLWLEKAEDIGEHLPLDELAKKLYEIELRRIARHKKDRTSDPLVSNRTSRQIYEPSPVSASQQHGISFEDMQKAIQNALAQKKLNTSLY
ncbi:unnamed protein product [Rhizophagus irregularis]|nr:unnamed protein product [Rhizophagus irregularis]